MVKRMWGRVRDWFTGGPIDSGATVHRVEVRGVASDYDRRLLKRFNLRPGMWVTFKGEAGILTGLKADGQARVMLVQADGTNLMPVLTKADWLRRAYYDEIPEARRPTPEIALERGYEVRTAGGSR